MLGEVKAYGFVAICNSSPAQSPQRSYFSGCCIEAVAVYLGSVSCLLTISGELASKYLTWLLHVGKNSCRKPKIGLVYFCPRRCHWRARKGAGLVIVLTAASWSLEAKSNLEPENLEAARGLKIWRYFHQSMNTLHFAMLCYSSAQSSTVCSKAKWFLGGGGKRFMSLETLFK